jgi:hypothetical protein
MQPKQPRIILGHGGGEPDYIPPTLFAHLRSVPAGELQKQYILDEMVEMIRAGKMSVTDMLAQPGHVRDLVGMSLHNIVIDPDTHTQTTSQVPLPTEVSSYLVKVRVIPGRAETIKYKSAVIKDPRGAKTRGSTAISTDGGRWNTTLAKNVDKWVDYDSTEAEIPLPEAWVCLSQYGRNCRSAKSLRLQMIYWKFEEVLAPSEPEPRGPGRPRKEQ